jgi:hypothetical protein
LPADIVVGESYLRGVRGFDPDEALDLMLKEVDSPPPPGHRHSGREGLASYLAIGYVPVGTRVPGVGSRVVVRTTDRIVLGLAGASELVDAMLVEHAPWLAEQGLATVSRAAIGGPLGKAAIDVAGAPLEVSIARA